MLSLTPSPYKFAPYHPRYESQVSRLQRYLWASGTELNAAYFRWKYHENPYLDENLVYFIIHGERVIGMRGFAGSKWEFGDSASQFVVPCAGDLVIDPQYRGQGLFHQLMEFALDDIGKKNFTHVFNLSGSAITFHGSLKQGWRSPGPYKAFRWEKNRAVRRLMSHMDRLRKLMTIDHHEQTKTERPRRLNAYSNLDAAASKTNFKFRHGIKMASKPPVEEMVNILDRIRRRGTIRHVRDREYLSWRFQNPRRSYRFLLSENKELDGYLVLSSHINSERQEVHVADIEALNENVRKSLLKTVIEIGKFEIITVWAPIAPSSAVQTLKALTFRELHPPSGRGAYRPGVMIKPTNAVKDEKPWNIYGQNLLDISNWDVQMIYSDNF